MSPRKLKTQYPGVRYRESSGRLMKKGQLDRYFFIRYQLEGRTIEEALGWASEGWNAEKAHGVLARIKENIRTGLGPRTLAEIRSQAAAARQAESETEQDTISETLTLDRFFEDHYLPRAQREKRSWMTDRNRYLKLISPALGQKRLVEISTDDLQRFVNGLADGGAAPATIKQYLGIVRGPRPAESALAREPAPTRPPRY